MSLLVPFSMFFSAVSIASWAASSHNGFWNQNPSISNSLVLPAHLFSHVPRIGELSGSASALQPEGGRDSTRFFLT